jgi:hypothetical protein
VRCDIGSASNAISAQISKTLYASLDQMVRLKFTTILIGIIFLTSCLSTALSDGSDTIIKEVPNVKMNKKAILFLREAGTTVDNSYQVSIIDFNSI